MAIMEINLVGEGARKSSEQKNKNESDEIKDKENIKQTGVHREKRGKNGNKHKKEKPPIKEGVEMNINVDPGKPESINMPESNVKPQNNPIISAVAKILFSIIYIFSVGLNCLIYFLFK